MLGGLAAAVGLSAGRAAAQKRVARLGYLVLVAPIEPPSRERRAFLEGLRELGYVPGRNLEILYASAQNEEEFLPDVCRDLVARKVDVIVVSGAKAALAAKECAAGVPVVIQALGDPVGIGAVRSLSRPEGNLTGVSFLSSELAGKRVQLVRELVPAARRVAVLWDPRNRNAVVEAQVTIATLKQLGLLAQPVEVSDTARLKPALEHMRESRPDALYVAFEGGLVAENRTYLAEYALRIRVPLVSGWSFITEAGGLASYAPDLPALFRRSASFVDRILKGARPSELPIEQASVVELVVNMNSARALGVKVPRAVLVRADRVIG